MHLTKNDEFEFFKVKVTLAMWWSCDQYRAVFLTLPKISQLCWKSQFTEKTTFRVKNPFFSFNVKILLESIFTFLHFPLQKFKCQETSQCHLKLYLAQFEFCHNIHLDHMGGDVVFWVENVQVWWCSSLGHLARHKYYWLILEWVWFNIALCCTGNYLQLS